MPDRGGTVGERFQRVMEQVAAAAGRAGIDPAQVMVVAVSKRKPAQAVISAMAAGARVFGENYLQEAMTKIEPVREAAERLGARVSWHMIGHLQRNKARMAARRFAMIQSVDRVALMDALQRESERQSLVLPVLLEVNLSGEESKSGASESAVADLVERAGGCANLRIEGLMTIPPLAADPEEARPYFRRLRHLRDRLAGPNLALKHLSMGMSADYPVAIEEGATIVRVGQAIFGPRGQRGGAE